MTVGLSNEKRWISIIYHSILITSLLLVLAAFAGCRREPFGDFTSGMHGIVLDNVTKLPLDSAWACIHDTSQDALRWYSDSTGFFEVWDWGTPTVDVFVGKSGYITETRRIQLKRTISDTTVFKLHGQDVSEIE